MKRRFEPKMRNAPQLERNHTDCDANCANYGQSRTLGCWRGSAWGLANSIKAYSTTCIVHKLWAIMTFNIGRAICWSRHLIILKKVDEQKRRRLQHSALFLCQILLLLRQRLEAWFSNHNILWFNTIKLCYMTMTTYIVAGIVVTMVLFCTPHLPYSVQMVNVFQRFIDVFCTSCTSA